MSAWLLTLLACDPSTPEVGGPARHPGGDSAEPEDTGEPVDTGPSLEERCAEAAPIPVRSGYLPGFTGAEDFAFDAEGWLVSIDAYGSLVRINQAGDQQVIVPNATFAAAGTRFLPDGDLVFCDVQAGSLVRVDPETGESTVVTGGLEYPNGLDVGLDGFVYVSEQNAGRVRRIDPATGDYTVIVEGLYHPNGVTFAPGYERLYVGSFGAGVVWASDRIDDTTWTLPRIYATSPDAPGVPPEWCDTHELGAACPLADGYSVGACADDGAGGLDCEPDTNYSACDSKSEGDACTADFLGTPVEQTCHDSDAGLYCPRTSAAAEAACEGKAETARCTIDDSRGQCVTTFDGVRACWNYNDYYEGMKSACDELAIGDDCVLADEAYPIVGTCGDGAVWGLSGNVCMAPGSGSMSGGLDAINADECGNVYVSEYIVGAIWRFAEEGAPAEKAAQLESQWIPNMHWGNGRGGWDENTLYVMDRVNQGVFSLPLDVAGHGDAYVPPAP